MYPATTSTGVDCGVTRAWTLVTLALQVSSRVRDPRRRLHRDALPFACSHYLILASILIEKNAEWHKLFYFNEIIIFGPLTLTFSVFICLSLGPSFSCAQFSAFQWHQHVEDGGLVST